MSGVTPYPSHTLGSARDLGFPQWGKWQLGAAMERQPKPTGGLLTAGPAALGA